MQLSRVQARSLYLHLIGWNDANPYDRKTSDGKIRTDAHKLVASWVEAAASQSTVYELLVYLEGPLKQLVRSSFNGSYGVKPKLLGYSHKEVRKQVLFWLGSSFQVPPRQLTGTAHDHHRLLAARWLDDALLVGGTSEAAAETTRIAGRLDSLNLDIDDIHTDLVDALLRNDSSFPYRPWKVTEWDFSNDLGHPVIKSVSAGWSDVLKQPELTQKLELVPVDPVVPSGSAPSEVAAKTPRTRKKPAIREVQSVKMAETDTLEGSVFYPEPEKVARGWGKSGRRTK